MYKEFADLCDKKGVTPYRVAKDCGFSNVTLSDWKNKGTMPKADKLILIADYFDTTLDYLIRGKKPEWKRPQFMEDKTFMSYIKILWDFPLSYKKSIYKQIDFELSSYQQEYRKKESSLRA